jgi:outer membrane lipoprotein-sorting protein
MKKINVLTLFFIYPYIAFVAKNALSLNNSFEKNPHENEVSKIIAKVETNYKQIKTICGRILQTRSFKDNKVKSKLNFFLKHPDKLYLDCLSQHGQIQYRQIIVSNGKTYWLYSPLENKAIKFNLEKMKTLTNSMLSPVKFLGINIFEQLKEAFTFGIEGRKDERLIIYATPTTGGKLIGKVKIEIDPIKWLIYSFQIFDKKNTLISQTVYKRYHLFNKSIWFPLEIKIKSLVGKDIVEEDISFHRIKLNCPIPEEKFDFNPPKEAKILFMK